MRHHPLLDIAFEILEARKWSDVVDVKPRVAKLEPTTVVVKMCNTFLPTAAQHAFGRVDHHVLVHEPVSHSIAQATS